jgi:cytoskeletal protein CcmA (bactofilin family)
MLNKKSKENTRENPSRGINVIGEGTKIEGDLKSNGDLRVDGTLVGTVHTTAKLVLGATGRIEGEVHAQNADISGKIEGNVLIKEVLLLQSQSRIDGDIRTGKLVVEAGGEFNGKCSMGSTPASLNSHREASGESTDKKDKAHLAG